MDNIREPRHEESIRRSPEGYASLDDLERDRGGHHGISVDKVIKKEERQVKKKALHCATYTTGIQGTNVLINPVIFPLGIHLPEDTEIGSLYLENRTTCGMIVYEGSGGSGRIIAYAGVHSYRVVALADGISSVSIVVDTTVPTGDGLVIATLFSHKWSPKMGTIV